MDYAINILYEEKDLDKMIKKFGELLNESWKLKKTLSKNISNSGIDNLYEKALKAGAYGGKITGAGGGGFFLMVSNNIKKSLSYLKQKKLNFVDFSFDNLGSRIIEK